VTATFRPHGLEWAAGRQALLEECCPELQSGQSTPRVWFLYAAYRHGILQPESITLVRADDHCILVNSGLPVPRLPEYGRWSECSVSSDVATG
jgi:hypothetical protein